AQEFITDGNDLVRHWIRSVEESAATDFQGRAENDLAAVVDAHLAAADDLAVSARRIDERRERAVPGRQQDLAANCPVRGNGHGPRVVDLGPDEVAVGPAGRDEGLGDQPVAPEDALRSASQRGPEASEPAMDQM